LCSGAGTGGGGGRDANYDVLVPSSFVRTDGCGGGDRFPPVHSFGFGKDHDAVAMHTIAEVTGGTFSFIENEAAIQDGFVQCIGGLLTVAVQEFHFDAETWRGPDGPRGSWSHTRGGSRVVASRLAQRRWSGRRW